MKIIKVNKLPFDKERINVLGLVFTKNDALTDEDINYERIITAQIYEMWALSAAICFLIILLFGGNLLMLIPMALMYYIMHGLEFWIRLWTADSQKQAYNDVCFEVEALENKDNLDYMKTRKHFAWFKLIKPFK